MRLDNENEGGYQDFSRSNRSAAAIKRYEVPLSMITRDLIGSFLDSEAFSGSPEDAATLSKVPLDTWKHVAKDVVGRASRHHTGKYFRKTDHYNLDRVGEKILEMGLEAAQDASRQAKSAAKKAGGTYAYGVIAVSLFERSRGRFKCVGISRRAGIIVGDNLYYKPGHSAQHKNSRCKISAKQTNQCTTFPSLPELIKANPRYAGTENVFADILAEKGL